MSWSLRRMMCVAAATVALFAVGMLGPDERASTVQAAEPNDEADLHARSATNMKEIMLGMLNYEDKTRKLPANITDKNGKPLLSWRVSILPEVEQAPLFHQFRRDEPWDSEHNMKLLSKMPAVYRNPKQAADSTNASYFMPVGKGMFGNAGRLGALADGTSKTVALVEAKRDIPWTKPEDIEVDVDPEKPLPKFGGFLEGQFNAGFADGHVLALPEAANPKLLRALFTFNGSEPVSEDDIVVRKPPVLRPTGDPRAELESTRRALSANNLKQISLGILNHESARKRYPPAAIRDKNGKALLSWRVAILPYLDERNVFKQFRLDEPWDSDHNLKLLDRMPKVYRHPMDDPATKNSSYFMVTGKGTVGHRNDGATRRSFTDGSSKTIVIVEAKRDIPWTKPEEIEIDPDATKPLPKLGGFFDGLFTAALADGSVRTISDATAPAMLRALFTTAGGEIVPPEVFESGHRPQPAPRPIVHREVPPQNEAARRNKSMHNMKSVVLGIHNYEDRNKKLPANMRDKEGKPLLSWRVAILPEIDEVALYQQFRLDESWDSEHNKKLIEKIPAIYHHPKDDVKSTSAAYYMPTGKGTIGPPDRTLGLGRIRDGTSSTIALVEAKRDIPWTKPEDIEIEFDTSKPLAKFGGYFPQLFIAGFADGHVGMISSNATAEALRPFFTIDGREVVSEDELLRKFPIDWSQGEK
jgi:prepilin-type processing-associated H-X9-DG protein